MPTAGNVQINEADAFRMVLDAPMDNSQGTLHRVEQNDAEFIQLQIGYPYLDGGFKSIDAGDYSRLGTAIGNNTHLKTLNVALDDEDSDAANNEFFNGLKQNSSIIYLVLDCDQQTLVGGVGHEILKSYQKNNSNLSLLDIEHAVLDNGGCNVITETLRWCRHLETIALSYNSITDEQLLPMVEAIKGGCNTSLENLYLDGNRIGIIGCEALVTLLEVPSTKLQYFSIFNNNINDECATAIANSLACNTKLKTLNLSINPFEPSVMAGAFCSVLCNATSVNDTYRSNHTLEVVKNIASATCRRKTCHLIGSESGQKQKSCGNQKDIEILSSH